MLEQKVPTAPPDPLSEARATVDRLSAALAKVEAASAAASAAYDRELQVFVISGRNAPEPSLEPQRAAEAKAASLKRLLDVARNNLDRVISDEQNIQRAAAIKASGSRVAALSTAADTKLAEFEAAVAATRRVESELIAILFSAETGLRQQFVDPQAQRDANWLRHRLRHRVMLIGEQAHVLVDARFDTDTGHHLGPLENRLYDAAKATKP
jgi:hypothetical protein